MINSSLDNVLKSKKLRERFCILVGGEKGVKELIDYLSENNFEQKNFICNLSDDAILGYQADYMDFENNVFIPLFVLNKQMLEMAHFKKQVEIMKKSWQEKNITSYLAKLHRRYYSDIIKILDEQVVGSLDDKYIWDCFEHIWIDSEYLNGKVDKELILKFFKLNPDLEKSREDLKEHLDEDGYLTVYRGESSKSVYHLDGAISWTLSKEKAIWFANRYSGDGDVYQAKIKLSEVLSYITSRSEDEIIFDAENHDGFIERLDYY